MLLTVLLLLPLIFGVVVLILPREVARTIALLGAVVTFLVSLGLLGFDSALAANTFAFEQKSVWLPEFGLNYHVGVDGASAWLVMMSAFLQIFGVAISWNKIGERQKEFYFLLGVLETAIIGSFCALDLVLFYIFFELTLIPTYFLVGIWGGKRRERAANKFFLYALVGSLLMLGGILALHFHVRALPGGARTFDFVVLRDTLAANPLPPTLGLLLFGAFFAAFAVKVPLFPLHTWLVDFYSEAPLAALIILVKLGGYGLYRFCLGLFPEASRQLAPLILALSVVGILYGALIALVQRDLRRLAAYSSISHLGFVTLGLFSFTPQGLTGAMYQMVSYNLTSAALLLMVGFLESRRATSSLQAFGGLWGQMPLFGRVFLVVTLSSVALPLTNSFVGEFLILLGVFQTAAWAGGLATIGVILSAAYMLVMFQKVMYGPVAKQENRRLGDLSGGEIAVAAPFVVLIFLFGVLPSLITREMAAAVAATLNPARTAPAATHTGGAHGPEH